uniref:Ovule protein n=1 Tax=Ascaris lumbricoides TaxID=6252 RepID=A0A0M3HJ10_ASCLU
CDKINREIVYRFTCIRVSSFICLFLPLIYFSSNICYPKQDDQIRLIYLHRKSKQCTNSINRMQ